MGAAVDETSQYTISDLAQEFGITTRSIRHYEDVGLLSPQRIGQARLFTSADRTKLKLILRGKRLGISLEESRDIIEMYDPSGDNAEQLQRLLEAIQGQRERLSRQLEDIAKMMRDLNEAEAGCLAALKRMNGAAI